MIQCCAQRRYIRRPDNNFGFELTSIQPIGGSRGGVRDARPPPWASKFFRFHAVFGKIWRVHAPPGGFTPPPSGKSWIRHCVEPHFNSVSKEKFENYSSGASYVIKLSFTQNYFGTSSGKYSQF